MSRRARRKQERRKTLAGWLVGAASALMLVSALVWGQMSGGPRLDSVNCPEDGNYAAQIAILVDPSDSLTSVQRSVVPRILEAIELDAPETAEIRVYALSRAGRGDTASVLRMCVPGHPDGVSSLTGNPQIAAREYEEFYTSLQRDLSALLDVQGDIVSPLLEGIQATVVNAFQPRTSSTPRQLLIASDMLQNSPALSFYREPVDFGSLSRNPDYGTLRVDLSRVEVSVFLLARGGEAGRLQGANMRRFWEDYFLDQGAHPAARPRWVNVEG